MAQIVQHNLSHKQILSASAVWLSIQGTLFLEQQADVCSPSLIEVTNIYRRRVFLGTFIKFAGKGGADIEQNANVVLHLQSESALDEDRSSVTDVQQELIKAMGRSPAQFAVGPTTAALGLPPPHQPLAHAVSGVLAAAVPAPQHSLLKHAHLRRPNAAALQ